MKKTLLGIIVLTFSAFLLGLYIVEKSHTQEFEINNSTICVTYPTRLHIKNKVQSENGLYCGFPTQIAMELQGFLADTIFDYLKEAKTKRCFIKVFGNVESQEICRWIVQYFDIKADTLDIPTYVLDLHNAIDYVEGSFMLCTSDLLAHNIRQICKIPVKPLYEVPNRVYKVPNLSTKHNPEEMAELLRSKCQIELAQSDTTSICLIRYR